MHYAVPRILHRDGRLTRLFTDIAANRGWLRLFNLIPTTARPSAVRRLLNRVPRDVPSDLIRAKTGLGLRYPAAFARTRTETERLALFVRVGREFGSWVAGQDWGRAGGVFVYNTAGEEILTRARKDRLTGVVEQTIAPYAFESALLNAERQTFPRWDSDPSLNPDLTDYALRERREWELADRILCGSEFVKSALKDVGGPAEKCVVVPYGVDRGFNLPPRAPHPGKLRVLTVGAVGLRKGAPYAIEAAAELRDIAEFRWVGPIKVADEARRDFGSDVDFTDAVPRDEVIDHYRWADVFLLPSLCEGSATASYEALTSALPVVCTPNTGSVVRDGVEGFVVAPRDVPAIVDRLRRLAGDAELRRHMGIAAAARAAEFDYEAYARGLLAALR